MLSSSALSVSYGPNEVLHKLDLPLTPGEVLGLIGPNGSGKTTLIRALSGVVAPSSGSVQLEGKRLADFSDGERATRIAVVSQAAQLPPAFTVFECVSLGRTPHLSWLGQLGARDLELIQHAMQTCEITALADRRCSELSGGEQQRVLLARALAQDCPILLLDEPTSHLDLHHQVALLTLVRNLAKEKNLAVLVAMHDLNLAALYADRMALLIDGRLRASGTPTEVLTADLLQEAFRIPLQVHPNPHQAGVPWVVL